MPRNKKPGKEAFDKVLPEAVAGLPSGYGTLLKARRPDLDLQHIYHVRHGKAVDWDVLEEFKKLSKEFGPKPVAA